MQSRRDVIVVDPADNVATAIRDLEAGACVDTGRGQVTLVCDVPFGHKFALEDIEAGEPVVKYGAPIGRATVHIRRGDHVHVHNVLDITDEIRKGV